VVASAHVERLYHSVALLLPDGRVLSAGSSPHRENNELRMEIYRPPYFFRGARPVISSVAGPNTAAPQQLIYGQQFKVSFTHPGSIRWISLIRPGATTHCIDMEQRLVEVPFTSSGTVLNATMPENPNLAPPGYYMLFISDQNDIPSIARWVQVLPAT
jgi:hypothetical protein